MINKLLLLCVFYSYFLVVTPTFLKIDTRVVGKSRSITPTFIFTPTFIPTPIYLIINILY